MPDPVVPLHGRRFYLFGPFRLDPGNRLLLRDGEPVPLTGKVFDVLLFFVENHDRLLTKDEILKSVWPDSFVEEGNLARHVSTLRKALGEGPNDHTYIVTITGRGYRFVAHVSWVADRDGRGANLRAIETVGNPLPAQQGSEDGQAIRRRWSPVLMIASLVAAGSVVAALAMQWMRPGPVDVRLEPLSVEWRTNTGDVYGPTISHDGNYLAYISLTPDDRQGLRVRQVASGSTIDVITPAVVEYWGVRFSPRGDYLYYLVADRASHSVGRLYRVPTLGGRSEQLLENVNGALAPSPDGRSIALVRINASVPSAEILSVASSGGPPKTIVTLDWPVVVQSLDWSADGQSLRAVLKRRAGMSDEWQIVEIPIAGGPQRTILPPRRSKIVGAVWLPERRGFLMTAVDPETGLTQIWHVGTDGTERRLTNDQNTYKDLSLTADGGTILAQSLGHLGQLWVAPLSDPAQPRQLGSATARGAFDGLAWTQENQLLYNWVERGTYDIWRMAPDGGARHQLTDGAQETFDTSVAPDGRFVFFVSKRSGSRQIWRMKPGGEELRQLTQLDSLVFSPIASVDGRWVYFSADPRGLRSLWRMTIDGESMAEVSGRAIELFDLSPDGHRLAYSYRDPDRQCIRVAVQALDGSGVVRHFDIEPTFALRWTPDGQSLAFTHRDGNIRVQPANGGDSYGLTRVHPGFKAVSFDWSRDGRHLAYALMASPVDGIAFRLR